MIAVTGANRGIGAAIALALAREAYRVACLTRGGGTPDTAGAGESAERLLPLKCDVLDEQSVRAALARAAEEPGGLVGLVNNAGLHTTAKSAELATAEFERLMAINATAVFAAAREAHPHSERRRRPDRQYRLVLRQARGQAQSGLLRVESGGRCDHALPRGRMGARQYPRGRCRAWLYPHRPQPRGDGLGAAAQHLEGRIPRGEPGTADEVARLVAALFREDLRFLSGETIYIDGAQGIATNSTALTKAWKQMNTLERRTRASSCPKRAHAVRERAGSGREQFAPRAEHYDRSAEFPWDNVKAINALGLNAMFIPEAYGGAPMSYSAYLACVREISKACAATGIIWATNFHGIKPVITFGSEEQKQRLLPRVAAGGLVSLVITEAAAGSDATGMKTRFEPQGEDIVMNGSKIFITSGDAADLLLVFGKWSEIADAKRDLRAGSGKRHARLVACCAPKTSSGCALRARLRCRSTAAACRARTCSASAGDGFKILLASLNKSRPSVAAHALGIARGAFEDAVGYINERRQSGRRIIEFQGIQFMLADLASELALCERWLWHVGALVDAGKTTSASRRRC